MPFCHVGYHVGYHVGGYSVATTAAVLLLQRRDDDCCAQMLMREQCGFGHVTYVSGPGARLEMTICADATCAPSDARCG